MNYILRAALMGLTLAALPAIAAAQDPPMCPLPGSPCNPGGATSQPNVNGATGAGNPIDVVTGNKYAFANDVDWDGALAVEFQRHYNSSAGVSAELGAGWSHGFGIALRRAQRGTAPATIRVRQGDGRDIDFVVHGAPRDGVQAYVSRPAGYGVIEERVSAIARLRSGQRNAVLTVQEDPEQLRPWTWRWLDGKRVEFDGRGLARRLSQPDGARLEWSHDAQRRLARVRDAQGRELTFDYWDAGAETLSRFDTPPQEGAPRFGASQGRLKSVRLPDGARITYLYDEAGLLGEVRFPDRTRARYEYVTAGGQPRLARVFARDGRLEAEYAYDETGRAVRTQTGDKHLVEVAYRAAPSVRGLNETWLRNGRGDVSVYRWRLAASGPQLVEALGPGCASCAPTNERYRYDATGRLIRVERLSETDPRETADAGRAAAPRVLAAVDTRFDEYGRVLEISHTEGATTTLVERRRYAPGFAPGPAVLERPSVEPGKFQSIEIRYDAGDRPVSLVERGVTPRIAGGRTQFAAIERVTTLGYTPEGRLAWIDGPQKGEGDRVAYRYSPRGLVSGIDYPAGVRETFDYDDLGRLRQRRAPDGVSWAYRHAPSDVRYLSTPTPFVVARATEVSVFSFAPTGALAGYRTPRGERFDFARDAAGLLTRVADARGFSVDYAYDAEGNRLAEDWRARSGARIATRHVRLDYDAHRRLSGFSAHPAERLRFGYDDTGALESIDDPASEPLRVVAQSDGRIQELLRESDAGLQRLASFSLVTGGAPDPGALPRSTQEDGEGAAPEDHAGTRLITRAQRALAADWSALWPAHAARFETLQGPNGDAHGIVYDDFGRVVHAFSSDAGASEYAYGAGDEPLSYCRANGTCEKTEYDALGRPVRITHSGAGDTSVVTFEYAGLRLARLANEVQETRWRYDAAGRLVERVDKLPVGEYRYAWDFDAAGRLLAQHLPDGSRLVPRFEAGGVTPVALDLVDADGRARPLLADIRHNAVESFTGFRYGNGVAKRMSFDAHGRLMAVGLGTAPRDGALLASVIPAAHGAADLRDLWRSDLSFDAFGRLDGIERDGRLAPVRTDADGRLLEIGGATRETFAYDAGGNLVRHSVGAAELEYAYETASNRLARSGGRAVEHDPAGNVTRLDGLRITYGADNRPRTIERDDGATVRYAHNALGERVRRSTRGTDAWFLYGDARLESEVGADGRVARQYVFLGDEPVARIDHAPRGFLARHSPDWLVRMFVDAPRLIFIHADPLGTPRYATDENQDVVWSARYDAYGRAEVAASSTVRLDLRFAGQVFDDVTGLHYNYLRDYSPTAARYLQPDPAGPAGGLNPYEYAGANPLAAVDTQGTSIVSWLGKRAGMRIVQREIRDYVERFARTRIGQIVRRYSDRFSNMADQFGEADEIMQILNSAEGIGVWDVVGLIPVIGDAVDIGRTARQLCRIRDLMKRLDRKLIGFNRLPATGGAWSRGVPGNGVWRLNDGREIPFVNGFPDFSRYAQRLPNGQNSIRITLGASHNADMAEVARQMRRIDPNWRQPPNTIWHHDTNCGVMILVDASINAIAHSGGRALHEQGLCP